MAVTKHGEAKDLTPEYTTWREMRRRCNSPAHPAYSQYGGRGIKVCERWNSYVYFLLDMGRRPSDGHSIDRVNNSRGYSPDNCRWATRREQILNSSQSNQVTANGVTQSVTEWAEQTGIKRKTIYQRLRKGWSHERAVSHGSSKKTELIKKEEINVNK